MVDSWSQTGIPTTQFRTFLWPQEGALWPPSLHPAQRRPAPIPAGPPTLAIAWKHSHGRCGLCGRLLPPSIVISRLPCALAGVSTASLYTGRFCPCAGRTVIPQSSQTQVGIRVVPTLGCPEQCCYGHPWTRFCVQARCHFSWVRTWVTLLGQKVAVCLAQDEPPGCFSKQVYHVLFLCTVQTNPSNSSTVKEDQSQQRKRDTRNIVWERNNEAAEIT